MITFKMRGSFDKTENFLKRAKAVNVSAILNSSGQEGVTALSRATPRDTGLAARSWRYEVTSERGVYRISWLNGDIENGFNVVIALQYGHGTKNGGYVQGIDFINPAIRPVFDKIAERVWKAVTSA
jgi:hypothetical protein